MRAGRGLGLTCWPSRLRLASRPLRLVRLDVIKDCTMLLRRILLALTVPCLAACVSLAQPAATPPAKKPAAPALAAPAEPPPFRLGGPEMYKMTLDVHTVVMGDVNGDGLTDIVVPENAYARILCLVQRRAGDAAKARPPRLAVNELPDDPRFEKVRYLAGKRIYDLAVGDLNSDGRDDLVFYGDPPELVIVFQNADGSFGRKQTFDIRDGAKRPHIMVIADFNGDKKNDLCMLGENSTYFIYQQADNTMGKPISFPGVPSDCFALTPGDYNGDGRTDLLYATGGKEEPFSIRLQSAQGRMSPEAPFSIPPIRAMIVGDLDTDGQDELLAIEQAGGRLVVYKLVQEPSAPALLRGQVRRYPLPDVGRGRARSMAVADLDGDGRLDVFLTDPASAQIEWFRQDKSGLLLQPEVFPSLQNATALKAVDLNGDGKVEFLVLSADEQVLGLASLEASGRIGFPTRIATENKPTAVGVGDVDGDGKPEIIYASTQNYDRSICVLKPVEGVNCRTLAKTPLKNAKSDPNEILVADANQDGRPDILVFEPFHGMRILVQNEEGGFEDVSQGKGYGAAMAAKLNAGSVAVGDVTGDGKPEIIVAQKNFARALRLDASGALQVVDQFNGREAASVIEGVAVTDLDGDKVNEVLLVDTYTKSVSVLKKQASGLYAIVQNVPIGVVQPKDTLVTDFDGDGSPDLVLFGGNRVVLFLSAAPKLELKEMVDYETNTPNGVLADVALGDLNGDGVPDIVLNETSRNTLEFLTYDAKAKALSARMKFQIFEKKIFTGKPGGRGEARVEPRVIEIADVTGDGKKDLILLIHDRVNLYPQE